MNLQNQVDYLQTLQQIDIFDGLSVPAPLNADTAKSAIMIRCGLLTPVYSEPEVMRAAIGQWSVRMQWTFKHLINIIQAEYSPIENTDRYSEHTVTNEGGSTRTHSGTDTRSETHGGTDTRSEGGTTGTVHGGTDTRTEGGTTGTTHGGTDTRTEGGTTGTAHGGTDTTTNEVSAYNSTGYQADRKETLQHGETETVTHGKTDSLQHGETETITHGKTDALQHGETETITHGKTDALEHGETISETQLHGLQISDQNNGTQTYTEHTHGNIGVTSNQQLIEQELALLRHFDIYGFIAEKFESEFCLMIY